MAVRFAFDLIDKMSAPANRITGAIDKLSKALAKADATTATTRTEKALARLRGTLDKAGMGVRIAFGDKAADMLQRFTQGELNASDKAEIVRKGLGMISGAAGTAATALGSLGAAALGLGIAGGKLLLDAQRFRDTTLEALKFSLGSSKAGQEAYGEILRISNVLGASSAEAASNFRELTAAGFGDRESKILLQLADDLKAANGGQAVALSSLAEPLQALKRNELLTADSFKGLEAAGMGKDRLYKVLAQQLKVAVKDPNDTNAIKRDVDRALATQRLRGQKAIDFWAKVNMAALDVEKLGQKGKAFRASTVTGSLDLVKNKWEALLASVNTSSAGQALVSALQRVAGALDPTTESGKQLLATIDRIVDAGARAFEALKPLGEGFGQGFSQALSDVGEALDLFGKGSGSSKDFASALKSIGVAFGEVVVGAGVVIGGVTWLVATIVEAIATLPENFRFVGREMMRGLGEGLDSAKDWLVSKLEGLAALLPESVRKLLQIRSPSRVMMQIGAHTAEGLAAGIEGGERQVERSAESLAVSAVRGGAQPTGQGGGQRPTLVLPPGMIQITVTGGADLDEIKRQVQEGLLLALREMGFELGVTTLWASLSSSRAPAPSSIRRVSARIGTRPSSTAPRCPAW